MDGAKSLSTSFRIISNHQDIPICMNKSTLVVIAFRCSVGPAAILLGWYNALNAFVLFLFSFTSCMFKFFDEHDHSFLQDICITMTVQGLCFLFWKNPTICHGGKSAQPTIQYIVGFINDASFPAQCIINVLPKMYSSAVMIATPWKKCVCLWTKWTGFILCTKLLVMC